MSELPYLFPSDYERETDEEPGLRLVAVPSHGVFTLLRVYVDRDSHTVTRKVEEVDNEADALRLMAELSREIEHEMARIELDPTGLLRARHGLEDAGEIGGAAWHVDRQHGRGHGPARRIDVHAGLDEAAERAVIESGGAELIP